MSVTVAELKTALQSARARSIFKADTSTRLKQRERTLALRGLKRGMVTETRMNLCGLKMAKLRATKFDDITAVGDEDVEHRTS